MSEREILTPVQLAYAINEFLGKHLTLNGGYEYSDFYRSDPPTYDKIYITLGTYRYGERIIKAITVSLKNERFRKSIDGRFYYDGVIYIWTEDKEKLDFKFYSIGHGYIVTKFKYVRVEFPNEEPYPGIHIII